jgi:hypothetical protein
MIQALFTVTILAKISSKNKKEQSHIIPCAGAVHMHRPPKK